jgi:hypothetical protein
MFSPRIADLRSYMGILSVLSLCGCFSAATLQATASPASALIDTATSGAPPNYTLAFSDAFAGTKLDTSKWNYRTGVRLLSEQLPGNVVVGSNAVNIDVGQQAGGSASWTGGGIISVGSFRYGYYQVNAQVTANPGWHTSFWVDAAASPTQTTEIDDFEVDTQTPTEDSMGLHSWVNGTDTDPARCNATSTLPGYDSATAMYSYGFEWTEQGITYYVDGRQICTQPYPAATYTHNLVNIQLSSIGYTADDISVANNPSPNMFANASYFVRDYYVNALEPGYTTTGAWLASSLPGFSNLPTQDSNTPGSSAQYTPNILSAGNYDVQVWKTQYANSDPAAPITVNSSRAPVTSQQDFTKGVSGWVDLGVYPFATGSTGDVVIGYSGTGYARSSMVKFVRE